MGAKPALLKGTLRIERSARIDLVLEVAYSYIRSVFAVEIVVPSTYYVCMFILNRQKSSDIIPKKKEFLTRQSAVYRP